MTAQRPNFARRAVAPWKGNTITLEFLGNWSLECRPVESLGMVKSLGAPHVQHITDAMRIGLELGMQQTREEPHLEILMRHRAVLFRLLGVFLIWAGFNPYLQPAGFAALACLVLLLAFYPRHQRGT